MFTWILVILLCSWKIETLVLKLKDQTLQTIQLQGYKLQMLFSQLINSHRKQVENTQTKILDINKRLA